MRVEVPPETIAKIQELENVVKASQLAIATILKDLTGVDGPYKFTGATFVDNADTVGAGISPIVPIDGNTID